MTSTSSSGSGVPRDQVAAVLGLLDLVPGSPMGVYLYGSAVDGGLRADSDLDLFGVIDRSLGPGQRRALVDGLLALSGRDTRPGHWRPIELTLVVHGEVVPWRYPPRFDFQYGEWLRSEFLAGDLEPWPPVNPDVAALVTMVIRANEALIGPAATELLAPVPRADLLRAMADELEPLLSDLESDTRNVLLTLARMWMTASTGEIRPKDVAAAWAAERLAPEHRPHMIAAGAAYLGVVEDRWDDVTAVRSVADELRRRLTASVGSR
jgi:predicted nucleotidyltransferase